MKCSLIVLLFLSVSVEMITAREYGGRWDDESIREKTLLYVEGTKERFAERCLRLSEVIEDFPSTVPYPALTDEEKGLEEKFLADRISDRDRERFFRTLMENLEATRLKLVEAEKEAFEIWEELPKQEKEEKAEVINGEIYGTEVSASNLGVLLDNSPSMLSYLDAVRAEIGESFPDAHYLEAAGSGVTFATRWGDGKREIVDDAWFYAKIPVIDTGENPFAPKWHQGWIDPEIEPYIRQVSLERSPISALMAFIQLAEVDTIYWFCDFEDDNHEASMGVLAQALETHGVTLFVHSSDRRPENKMLAIIEKTGGELIRKRIR